jgi:hypothetical protein
MRCDEVIRELAVPTDGRDDLALSRHLADCKACARWAEQAAKFDRLWEATRPAEPSAEAWDHLWSSVTVELDRPSRSIVNGSRSVHAAALTPPGQPVSSGRQRLWRGLAAVGIVGLAQAAALLIAVGIAPRDDTRTLPPSQLTKIAAIDQNSQPNLGSVFDVEEGEVAIIHDDGTRVRADDLAAQDPSNGVDEWYLFFNVLEPMARSVMAMAE